MLTAVKYPKGNMAKCPLHLAALCCGPKEALEMLILCIHGPGVGAGNWELCRCMGGVCSASVIVKLAALVVLLPVS